MYFVFTVLVCFLSVPMVTSRYYDTYGWYVADPYSWPCEEAYPDGYTCNDLIDEYESCDYEVIGRWCDHCYACATTTLDPNGVRVHGGIRSCEETFPDHCTPLSREKCEETVQWVRDNHLWYDLPNTIQNINDLSYPYGCLYDQNTNELFWNREFESTATRNYVFVLCPVCNLDPYVYMDRECDEKQFCTIETVEDCEAGATFLGNTDLTAKLKNSQKLVAGCSTGAKSNLRYNQDLDNEKEHRIAGERKVICKAC